MRSVHLCVGMALVVAPMVAVAKPGGDKAPGKKWVKTGMGPGVDIVSNSKSPPFVVMVNTRKVTLYQAGAGKEGSRPTVRVGSIPAGLRFAVNKVKRGSTERDWHYRIDWRGERVWIIDVFRRFETTTPQERLRPKVMPRMRTLMAVVNKKEVPVRTSPSKTGALGTVKVGQVYVLRTVLRDWVAIQYDQRIGWVHLSDIFIMQRSDLASSGPIGPQPKALPGATGPVGKSSTGGSSGYARTPRAVPQDNRDWSADRADPMAASQSDLEVLARIVKGECNARMSEEGRVAVAAVVLNRVRDSRWPNTIPGVAHQRLQFSCYNANFRDRLYYGTVPSWAWRAAQSALDGEDPTNGANHYFNPFLVSPSWANNLTFVRRIGDNQFTAHDFYK